MVVKNAGRMASFYKRFFSEYKCDISRGYGISTWVDSRRHRAELLVDSDSHHTLVDSYSHFTLVGR